MTAPRTAGSPVLRTALRDALRARGGNWNYLDAANVGIHADQLLEVLSRDPAVVEAFATALADVLAVNDAHIQHETSGFDMPVPGIARALVAVLLGDGS